GLLFFGGNKGLNYFDPQQIQVRNKGVDVAITGISKLNAELNLYTDLQEGALSLTYRDYLFSVTFSALDYTPSAMHRYRYRLIGLDTDWVDAGKQRRATYTNLAAGEYRFEVIAAAEDGKWSDPPASLRISVQPPPWKTPLAYGLYFLAVLVIISLVLLERRVLQQRARTISAMYNELTSQMALGRQQAISLENARQRAQSYLEIADVLMLSVDQSERIHIINQKGSELLGIPAPELRGRNWFDFIPPADQPRLRELASAARAGITTEDTARETPLLQPDGSSKLMLWYAAKLPAGPAGEADDLLVSGIDVTRMHDLEQRVREQEKLSAVGNMASSVAHDFNNVLAAIMGYASLSREETHGNEKLEMYVDRINTAARHATLMVDGLLNYTREQPRALEPVETSLALREAVEILEATLPPDIALSVAIPDDLPAVRADPTGLQQIIMNLGMNARKAVSVQTGNINVEASTTRTEAAQPLALGSLPAGSYLLLSVTDNGVGIQPEKLKDIFRPFYMSSEAGYTTARSSGLGLAIVSRIVTSHHGYIDVTSEPGAGTSFNIFLPLDQALTGFEGDSGASSDENHHAALTGRVLIADDEAWIRDILSTVLRNNGMKVTTCSDGQQVLQHLLLAGDDFDLVITDDVMPGLSGAGLIGELRSRWPTLPVILISGNREAEDFRDPLTRFLRKPFSHTELLETLQVLLKKPTQE
ncbi:MAG: response regulator, partial [Pseudomonadales bacterium]|nr:response regulator [Pseudomonadales bacterium]